MAARHPLGGEHRWEDNLHPVAHLVGNQHQEVHHQDMHHQDLQDEAHTHQMGDNRRLEARIQLQGEHTQALLVAHTQDL
jgi:hypothetical protein